MSSGLRHYLSTAVKLAGPGLLAIIITACGGGGGGGDGGGGGGGPAPAGTWTWISGSDLQGEPGNYGSIGVSNPTNVPGARYWGVTWIDSSDRLWLFGGEGYDSTGSVYALNDLWRWDGSNWTWISGSDLGAQAASYGVKGTPSAANVPGARSGAVSSKDNSGNLWLFGGSGYYAVGMISIMNDLWKWDGTNWTWVSGSNTGAVAGVYGTKGTPAPANVPGSRDKIVSWTDAAGNFWIFGGYGADDGTIGSGRLNDLWRWDGSNWTWISGDSIAQRSGVYGVQGVPDAANVPGAREMSSSWVDASGNFWLFGGRGVDKNGAFGYLNDLWRWDGSNWTWMSGSDVSGALAGVYGTQGTAAATNVPGTRYWTGAWTDASGNLWLYGGEGHDKAGTFGWLNDLWKWDGTNWTWVAGGDLVNQVGIYGTKGTADAANSPGGRVAPMTWVDSTGQLWLFGGNGIAKFFAVNRLNDLWRYQP